MLQCVALGCSVLHWVAVCCSVLQCIAVCCSVLQCRLVCTPKSVRLLNIDSFSVWDTSERARERERGRFCHMIVQTYDVGSPSRRHCNTLQHTATHCITLQHTATHCNTLLDNLRNTSETQRLMMWDCTLEILEDTATHCNTLQHTATHCNMLQRTATHCTTL